MGVCRIWRKVTDGCTKEDVYDKYWAQKQERRRRLRNETVELKNEQFIWRVRKYSGAHSRGRDGHVCGEPNHNGVDTDCALKKAWEFYECRRGEGFYVEERLWAMGAGGLNETTTGQDRTAARPGTCQGCENGVIRCVQTATWSGQTKLVNNRTR